MLEFFRTPRNLRIVAGGLGFLGMLYGLTAVLCLVRRGYSHALISGLALVVMVGLGLAAWLKSGPYYKAVGLRVEVEFFRRL